MFWKRIFSFFCICAACVKPNKLFACLNAAICLHACLYTCLYGYLKACWSNSSNFFIRHLQIFSVLVFLFMFFFFSYSMFSYSSSPFPSHFHYDKSYSYQNFQTEFTNSLLSRLYIYNTLSWQNRDRFPKILKTSVFFLFLFVAL